ncbi:MAG: transposase [Chloroflexota bacterium]
MDETGSDLGMTRPYSRAPRGQRAYGDVPGRRGRTDPHHGPDRRRLRAWPAARRGDRPAAFDAYVIHRLAPTLKADQIVVVDNLKVHYSDRAKSAIEARGAQLWYLPAYSPDLTPIEEAFSKFKGVLRTSAPRTVEAHSTAVWAALRTITSQDAAGWIAHAGYGPRRRRPKRSPRRRPAPLPPSRFPDAPPVITLQVPTPILFDHLW